MSLKLAAFGSDPFRRRHPPALPGFDGRCEGQGEDEPVERRRDIYLSACISPCRDEVPCATDRAEGL